MYAKPTVLNAFCNSSASCCMLFSEKQSLSARSMQTWPKSMIGIRDSMGWITWMLHHPALWTSHNDGFTTFGSTALRKRKALDNIDLNLVSHRYVSGVLKDDHFVSACSRAPRFWSIAARIISAIKRSIDLSSLYHWKAVQYVMDFSSILLRNTRLMAVPRNLFALLVSVDVIYYQHARKP